MKDEENNNMEMEIKVEVDRSAHKCENLLEAMQDVLEACENSQFCNHIYRNEEWAQYAFNYLNKHLGLTDEEAILAAIILENGTDAWASMNDVSKHLRCSKIEVMQRKAAFDSLSRKGFIVIDGKSKYGFSDEAFQSLCSNKAIVENCKVFDTYEGLFSEIHRLHKQAYHKEISVFTLHHAMDKLLTSNSNLSFVRGLFSYRDILNEMEYRFLIALALGWVDSDEVISVTDVDYIFYNESSQHTLGNDLISGKSVLTANNLVKCSCEEGLALYKGYMLTDKAKKHLIPELAKKQVDECVKSKLLQASKIATKSLFYNDDTDCQVSELGGLLKEKQLRGVLRFTCLFHGTPGTGKTETVYQLAKQTGRDIYQVDYSQLRSKWVGDSEKNVKAMFDEYRHLCKGAKRMPILLLNEADALIGKRLESAERAVDKGENAIQNIVLQEMENFDGIMIATTNLTGNIDSAFGRRFLYKIAFEKPNMTTRARIWKSMLPSLNNGDASVLSERFPLFAGGQIENVTRKVTVNEVLHGSVTKLDDIIILCKHETMDNNNTFGKVIGFRIK